MAFDRTNPTHLAQLNTEVDTDPMGMGYDTAQTQPTLNMLNDPEINVELPRPTTGERLSVGVLLDIPELAVDLNHAQVTEGHKLFLSSFMGRDFDLDIERFRPQIIDALRSNSNTVTALNALERDLSRAEVLWGPGTEITRADWKAARVV